MAVSEKTRAWFEMEYGYPLKDAYEVHRFMTRGSKISSPSIDIDFENEALADRIAKPTYVLDRK